MSDLKWMRPLLAKLVGDDEPKAYDEDVAQAVRCTEVSDLIEADMQRVGDSGWYVSIRKTWKDAPFRRADMNLPRAICLAISAALNWSEPK